MSANTLLDEIQQVPGGGARCLAWLIATQCRPSEAIGARWPEIDEAARLWLIPAEREKSGRGRVVHLSDEALALLGRLGRTDDLMFSGTSLEAVRRCLKRFRPAAALHDFHRQRAR